MYDIDKDGKISRIDLLKVSGLQNHHYNLFGSSASQTSHQLNMTDSWVCSTGSPEHAGDAGDRGATRQHSRPHYTGSRFRWRWCHIVWGVSQGISLLCLRILITPQHFLYACFINCVGLQTVIMFQLVFLFLSICFSPWRRSTLTTRWAFASCVKVTQDGDYADLTYITKSYFIS